MSVRNGAIASKFLASAGSRLIVLPITGACSLLTAHAVSGGYGTTVYALFALVSALPFLFPTPDLGLGAALMSAAARLPQEEAEFADVHRRVTRVLAAGGATAAAVCIVVGASGLWTAVIPSAQGRGLDWAITVAMLSFAVSIFFSGGAALLVGLGKNHLVSYLQALVPVATYAVAGAGALLALPLPLLLALSTVGLPLSSIACSVVAARDPRVRAALHTGSRAAGRNPVFTVAIPMLVIIVTSALTIQPGRLVLDHISTIDQVAQLTAAYSLFLPVLSVVQTAGRSFWPAFVSARALGEPLGPIVRVGLRLTVLVGLGGAAGLAILGPPVARWATHDLVSTPLPLFVVLGACVLVVAVHQVSAMFLNDPAGLWYQSGTSCFAMLLTFAGSVVLAGSLGAQGIGIALLVGFTLGQAAPCAARVLARLKRTDLLVGP